VSDKAQKIAEAPLVLKGRRWPIWIAFSLGLVVALFGWFILLADQSWEYWLLALGGSAIAAACSLFLLPGRYDLCLDRQGFSLKTGMVDKHWRWDAVKDIRLGTVSVKQGRTTVVVFDTPDQNRQSGFRSGLRRLVRRARDWDEFIPAGFGASVEELRDELIRRQRQALDSPDLPGKS